MAVREWLMHLALTSVRKLRSELPKLTDEELHACLHFEIESSQRKNVLALLKKRLADLSQQNFEVQLKEQLKHGTSTVRRTEQS